jgi:GH25 family lysozyme M1 (1,4-beta-N-acetylmuramidase)
MMLRSWRAAGAAAALVVAFTAATTGAAPAAGPAAAAPVVADPPVAGGGGRAQAGAVRNGTAQAPDDSGGVTAQSPAWASYPIRGIDVSSHDHSRHNVNWASLAASGVKFAYIKATEGTTYTNAHYAADYAAAKRNGILVGAYAFGRPDRGDPVGQADHLVDHSLWTVDGQTLVPFLDVEWPYGGLKLSRCWGLTTTQMSAWIRAFVERVTARIGRRPAIYTNANWWNPCTGRNGSFGAYPLSIASYTSTPPTLPAGWNSFTFWQYAAGNTSVAGNHDKQVFHGDLAELSTLAGSDPRNLIGFRAKVNGAFVTAEHAGAAPLIANRGRLDIWEQFDRVDAGNGTVALRSRTNGRYVTAERAGAAPLIANRTAIGLWERFDVLSQPTEITLRAHTTGKYVTAEAAGTAPLAANRAAVGLWEQFSKITLGNTVVLRSNANGRYVTAESAGAAPLIANRAAIGSWEQFVLVHNGDGTVSLRAVANGRYVSNTGGTRLIASSQTIGAAERFDLAEPA